MDTLPAEQRLAEELKKILINPNTDHLEIYIPNQAHHNPHHKTNNCQQDETLNEIQNKIYAEYINISSYVTFPYIFICYTSERVSKNYDLISG